MAVPRIAVVGTGANGAAIGADMVRAGHDVTFVEQWPAHVEAMRAGGLLVRSPDGTEVRTEVNAIHLCEVAMLREPFDVVFFGVKAYDTRWACELIKPLIADDGLVVGLQNGMTIDDVASIVGPRRTLGAVIEIAGNMFEPGIVNRQTGRDGTWFCVGAYDDAARGREEEVATLMRHAGTTDVTDDIRSAKWMKLVANAAEMVPSAILDVPLVDALNVPGMRAVMDAAGTEALEAALALGCRIVPMFGQEGIELLPPERYAAALLDAVLAGWSLEDTRVAVLQDWMKGRRAEGEEINGHVVEVLRRVGRDAPVNALLIDIARRIEAGELETGLDNAELML
ncbi:2-dehydropantoate 2-reductase [Conexibacter stalactiti]|uniref:2-dehydropantoate 2-reductase n=1 Tax=Conexibacter stalactiti TaxID=1940611 RepID=A0ABU4HMH5_9ACTN|nr:2-dehydropantoate 2-reductase [Conexibacter stalactiti]MDW5594506.1 2-dehydropantoate 2-reductase [Conexibacter stalactiti]MEC5035148.1 2-dehydropantoate 2-reductase [Conexibacter stalactiti]